MDLANFCRCPVCIVLQSPSIRSRETSPCNGVPFPRDIPPHVVHHGTLIAGQGPNGRQGLMELSGVFFKVVQDVLW
ncbi:hypothetical protein Mapa_000630 [Marchantia paleacea]|nr:hypothetical protein Mapa_000630 [Marchantia paleacea]